jgi:hypothetical protein
MACTKCGGFTLIDQYLEVHTFAVEVLELTRCINCGNREDAIICLNRTLPQKPGDATRRPTTFTHDVIAVKLIKNQ